MVAALYVIEGGPYFGLPGVDPWPESRDARLYAGPYPVVAHPPCARWSRLAGLVEQRWGHKRGDDGGCFAAALASVRRWGGGIGAPRGLGRMEALWPDSTPHEWRLGPRGGRLVLSRRAGPFRAPMPEADMAFCLRNRAARADVGPQRSEGAHHDLVPLRRRREDIANG